MKTELSLQPRKKNSKEKTKTWIWNKNSLAHWIHIAQTRWTWCFALKKICCASNNLFLFLFIFLWIRQFLSLVLNLDFHLVGWFSYFILGCVCVCDDLKSRKKTKIDQKKRRMFIKKNKNKTKNQPQIPLFVSIDPSLFIHSFHFCLFFFLRLFVVDFSGSFTFFLFVFVIILVCRVWVCVYVCMRSSSSNNSNIST